MVRYPKWLLPLLFGLLVIHFNYWMWDSARLILGVPVNLLYHIAFSVGLSLVMLFVARRAWPTYLSDD